ncbi:MAG: argininosuccinate synthase [Thermodesulfobacteriota bacterium]|nr:argininosuccinate synthase [Thermodesulfobacteriota bacterium]
MRNKRFDRIVLAYSGGLDTSVILKWLLEEFDCPVVAFAADLGQGEELEPLHEKARITGAESLRIVDLREEFVRDYVFPMLRANAVYEGTYLLGTSIARPCIAKAQMEIAADVHADAVSHGATGKGNDQVRFELTYLAMDPTIAVIAPWREWNMRSRSDLIAYAKSKGIPVTSTAEKPYSMDRNLLHLSFEGGILEDPWMAPPEDMYILTTNPVHAPDVPEEVVLGFEKGNPVAVNGKRMSPAILLEHLNVIAGRHGVGRVDMVENRYVGMKSRGVYETPGGTVIHRARRALESITLDREVMRLKDEWIPRYASLVYNGYWFSPERKMLQVAIDEASEVVSGDVRLRLYKGGLMVTGRRSDNSLYDCRFATFEEDEVYSQADAEGFIRLNALRLKIRAMMQKGIC